MQNRNQDEHLSIKETAELLNVSLLTLRNWDKKGILIPYRNPINNYRIYKLSQIQQFFEEIETSRKNRRFKLRVVSVKE